MSKIDMDYNQLYNKIYKKAYKLSEVKDQLEIVAFDVVRFKSNDDKANLWQIQKADDGEYIIALYQEEDNLKEASWDVNINKTAGMVQISYKGDPLVRLGHKRLGIPANELDRVSQYLPEKLASNKKLVHLLLNELDEATKKSVLNKYPELF